MIIAEISVAPMSEGTSLSRYVKLSVGALKKTGLKTFSGPMCTCVEAASLDDILAAVKAAHQAVIDAGAKRVITTLKIDDRRDKAATMETKMTAVK